MTDCNFGRPNLLKIKFHEFQEYEPQNNASHTKLYIRRSDTEVGMVAACHLGGLLGVDMVASVGFGKCRRLEFLQNLYPEFTIDFSNVPWNRGMCVPRIAVARSVQSATALKASMRKVVHVKDHDVR